MATTTQSRTRKTPQDHKPTQASVDAAKQERFEDVEGHELLIPFSKIKGSDQSRLLNRVKKLLGDQTITQEQAAQAAEGDLVIDIDLEDFADLTDWVAEHLAINEDEFNEWTSGVNGMQRTVALVSGLADEVGKLNGFGNS